jgi:hypothetical protein
MLAELNLNKKSQKTLSQLQLLTFSQSLEVLLVLEPRVEKLPSPLSARTRLFGMVQRSQLDIGSAKPNTIMSLLSKATESLSKTSGAT